MTPSTDKGIQAALAQADIAEARRQLDSVAPGWRFPVKAAETLLDARCPVDVVLGDMPPPTTPGELQPLWVACADLALRAVLDFDLEALHRVARRCHELEQAGRVASQAPEARVIGAWVKLLEGDCEGAADLAESATALAHREGAPLPLLDGTVVSALAHLGQGDVDAATSQARRASRMARTEGILQREYLANLALARVRRYGGRVHLASRIVLALAQVVPTPWCNWIAFEFFLCGGGPPPRTEAGTLTRHLHGVSQSIGHGSWADALETTAESLPTLFASEVRSFIACADPRDARDVPTHARQWIDGKASPAPIGLSGFLATACGAIDTSGAYVLVEPGRPARRFLAPGVPLAANHAVFLPVPELKKRRTFELLCELALSGGRVAETELFSRLYGFGYVTEKHGGMLRTLVYRARQLFEGYGSIERNGDAMELRVARPVCIPDPRCVPTLEETILRSLAQNTSKLDATEIANRIGVPLRTVRRALSALTDDGSCVVEKVGRTAHFSVEDTTFYEPSFTRLGRGRREAVR